MNAVQPILVWCPGCEQNFTPSGLSQHVSRIRDLRCRRLVVTSQLHLASAAFPHMASPPTLSSTWAFQVMGEDTLGDEYNEPTQGASEFAVIHVAARAAALRKFYRW